jgi:hypothetical protein
MDRVMTSIVRPDHVAGEDNIAEHSLMLEPKIKNEICMGKMDRS